MAFSSSESAQRQTIGVIGSGIAGMSAAWLLNKRHDVTLFEMAGRLGGHTNTVIVDTKLGPTPVDTGFIVFNETTYPNLIALFDHLGVATQASDMSFGVSLNGGRTEYSSVNASAFLCGGRNLLSPRFWAMTSDLLRFYRDAPRKILEASDDLSLGEFLTRCGYCEAFQRDHILPQAAAIWSASMAEIQDYPARAFVRFFENHGLLRLKDRSLWRTVVGGSRAYVSALTAAYAARVRLNCGAVSVRRDVGGAWVRDTAGNVARFDHVVIAAHADEARAMLEDPSAEERRLLGCFRYAKNRAVLPLRPRPDAAPQEAVGQLELCRRRSGRRMRRFLLDEQAAAIGLSRADFSHAQSAPRAARGDGVLRDRIRAPFVRCRGASARRKNCGRCRACATLGLRRTFWRRVPRRRPTGRPRSRRAIGQHAPALARR